MSKKKKKKKKKKVFTFGWLFIKNLYFTYSLSLDFFFLIAKIVGQRDQLWLSYLGVTIVAPILCELHMRGLDGDNCKRSLKSD
jgi:hypothetical protein